MANPQKENGYTAIANEIMEKLISAGLNGTELAIVFFILRKTYGFQKKQDEISITQFEKIIPCTRRSILKGLQVLKLVKIITLVKKGSSVHSSNLWAFNKDYDNWQLVKKITLVKKTARTSEKKRRQLVKKSIPTKETIQKKETKEILSATADEEYSFNSSIKKMIASKDRRMNIIAYYWTVKGIKFTNKQQYDAGLKRELRPSNLLTGYENERIKEVVAWLGNQDFKFTLETVHKYIDENLKKLDVKGLSEDDLINNILNK